MIEFSVKDASILARVAQYEGVPAPDRRAILEQADTAATRLVGRILIGDNVPASEDIREAATAVRKWVDQNRNVSSLVRRQARAVSVK